LSVTAAANGLYQELHDEGKLPVRLQIGYMIYPALQPVIDLDALLAMGVHSGLGDDWLSIGPAKLFVNGAGAINQRDQAAQNAALRLHHAAGSSDGDRRARPDMAPALRPPASIRGPTRATESRHRRALIHHVERSAGVIRCRPSPPSYPDAGVDDSAGIRIALAADSAACNLTPAAVFLADMIARLAIRHAASEEPPSRRSGVRHPGPAILLDLRRLRRLREDLTLEVGKLADLVLPMDPLSIAPEQLKDLVVDATILDGAVRYERPR
jgi:hypothetical protein